MHAHGFAEAKIPTGDDITAHEYAFAYKAVHVDGLSDFSAVDGVANRPQGICGCLRICE